MPAILDRLHAERARLLDLVDSICDGAESESRDLSETERDTIARHHARVTEEIDPQLRPLEELEVIRTKHNAVTPGVPSVSGAAPGRPGDPRALVISRALANEVRDAVRERRSIQRSLSDPLLADWQAPTAGAVRGRLAEYASLVEGTSPQAAFVTVRPTLDAAVVAEGAAKPEIADASTITAPHQKIAGYLEISLEQIVYGADVSQGIASVAFRQLIEGENDAVVAALAGATPVAAGGTPAGSVLAGIATVASGGGVASVVAVNPSDIPAVLGESSGNGYAVNSGGGAETLASTLWGVPVVASRAVTPGGVLVWDRAALGASVAMPPRILVDVYSKALNNITTVVVDEMIAFALLQPLQAAKVDLEAP